MWPLWDGGVAWVAADVAIDGDMNGTPDYYQFDYNCDGHVTLSDLSYFGQDMARGRADLSAFSAMGTIYNHRLKWLMEQRMAVIAD